jgi:MFS family permease
MMAMSNTTAFRRDKHTLYLYVMLAIFGFKQSVLGSVTPFLRDEMGLGTANIGWHFSIYALGLILSGRVVTVLGRKLPMDRILRLGAMAMVATILLVAVAGAVWATLSLSLLLGVTGGVVQISIQSSLAAYHGRHQGVALVEAFVMAAAGVFLGPLIIGYAAETALGWRVGLIVPAVLLSLTFLFFSDSFRGTAAEATETVDTQAKGGLPLQVYIVLGMILLGIATEWGIGFWGAQYLEIRLSLPPAEAVTIMSVFFGGTVVGRIVASRLLITFGVRPLLVMLIILGGLCVAGLALSSAKPLALAALFFGGACLGNFFPLILSVANECAPDRPTDVSRGATQAVGLALLIVPFAIGQLGEKLGLVTAFGYLAFFPLGMLVLLLVASAARR